MIRKDPRVEASDADLVESAKFQIAVRDKLSETHKTVNDLRATRKQINDYMATVTDTAFKKEMEKISKPMLDSLQQVEDELIQHKAKAFQDLLALPLMLNNKLANLAAAAASAETKPTQSTYSAQTDIVPSIDKQIAKLRKTLEEYVPQFNKKAETQKAAAIIIKKGS
jgi:chlorite dismutase